LSRFWNHPHSMKPRCSLSSRWMAVSSLVLAVRWCPGLGQAAPLPPPAQAHPRPLPSAQTFTLSNGMTLIVQPDRRAPTAVHMLWVRVGSMDEVDGTSGVAHVLEHMMFKGTPTLAGRVFPPRGGPGRARERLHQPRRHRLPPAGAGGQPGSGDAAGGRPLCPQPLADDEFRREMAVVKEERRQRTEDSPRARLFEAFSATPLWPSLPPPHHRLDERPGGHDPAGRARFLPPLVRAGQRRGGGGGRCDVEQVRAWAEASTAPFPPGRARAQAADRAGAGRRARGVPGAPSRRCW
jgi:hypothetical protein